MVNVELWCCLARSSNLKPSEILFWEGGGRWTLLTTALFFILPKSPGRTLGTHTYIWTGHFYCDFLNCHILEGLSLNMATCWQITVEEVDTAVTLALFFHMVWKVFFCSKNSCLEPGGAATWCLFPLVLIKSDLLTSSDERSKRKVLINFSSWWSAWCATGPCSRCPTTPLPATSRCRVWATGRNSWPTILTSSDRLTSCGTWLWRTREGVPC